MSMSVDLTVENMDRILESAIHSMQSGKAAEFKTLINSYTILCESLNSEPNDDIYLNLKSLNSQFTMICKIDVTLNKDVIKSAILRGAHQESYKFVEAARKVKLITRNLGHIIDTAVEECEGSTPLQEESNSAEELLEMSIKSGTLTLTHDETLRGIGKTTALVKKANELGAIMICPTRIQVEHAKEIAKSLGLCGDLILSQSESYAGRKTKTLLLDELVSDEFIFNAKSYGFNILGGFYRKVF